MVLVTTEHRRGTGAAVPCAAACTDVEPAPLDGFLRAPRFVRAAASLPWPLELAATYDHFGSLHALLTEASLRATEQRVDVDRERLAAAGSLRGLVELIEALLGLGGLGGAAVRWQVGRGWRAGT